MMKEQAYKKRFDEIEQNIKEKNPLVHNITNYVTVNDCANIQLAIGGSPIMTDEISEIEEVVSYANSLVLNIGTLNKRTIEAMILAGKKANELKIPIILDPVGVSFTNFRYNTVKEILSQVKVSVIKGNFSEILGLVVKDEKSKGVDASTEHENNSLDYKINVAKQVACELDCVIIVTGAKDIIVSKQEKVIIHNGHKSMSKVTGTGCMLSALLGVCCGANYEDIFGASMYGTLAMGICGQKAYEKTTESGLGTGSLKVSIIDNMSKISAKEICMEAKVDEKY